MTETEMLTLRPFEDKDYPAFVALHNLTHQDSPASIKEVKHFFETRARDIFVNEFFEKDEELIASVFAMDAGEGVNQVRIDLYLHPEKVGDELKEKLYSYLTNKMDHADAFVTRVREDWYELLAFYEAKGFAELERMWESHLDVAAFDERPFLNAIEKAKSAGIYFKTLADFPNNESTQRMLYNAVAVEMLPMVPVATPLNIWPFETWCERYWNSPERNPESVFLAFAGDELVGFCELYKPDDPTKLKNGLTAVKKEFQRKGIAMSLKLKSAQYAKSAGAKEIITQNHSINRPMLAINEAMGFRKDPAWIRLKKEIRN